jgi:hypothetical protein
VRLNLYWRGWDLVDIEVHLVRRRPADNDGPVLESAAGGQFELAEPEPYPDTRVRVGFR